MEQPPIRILLADDHMLVRAGLARVIGGRADMEVVGEAENGEEALFLCQKHRPDIVLMDVRMEGMGGIGATEAIRRFHPKTKVVGLSTFHDQRTVSDMVAAGASGFLSKILSAEELVSAILRVHAGEVVLTEAASDPTDTQPDPVRSKPAFELGDQQRTTLALLTKGYTNPEIARYLGVSVPTARYHVSALLAKLEVSNRAEAAALAVRERLVSADDF
jgi:NarL family two-component system response regulator LiaR